MTTDVIESPEVAPEASVPAVDPPDGNRPTHAAPGGTWVPPVPTAVVVVLVVAAGLVGLYLRLWFTFHAPSSSDEGAAAILAQQALHGHFQAFYGGQQYGGTAEPYLIAVAFSVFGQTIVVARLVLVALVAVAAVLVWRITLRVVGIQSVALLAGALAWSAPAVTVRTSVRLYGFRGVALVCGLAAVLLALRIHDGRRGWPQFAGLGVALGIGWWSTPEIAYVAVPVVVLLILGVVRTPSDERKRWWVGVPVVVVSFGIGALPWIWANIRSHLGSLATGEFAGHDVTFTGRRSIFFHYALPMVLGVTRIADGHRLFGVGQPVLTIAFLAVIVVSLVLAVLRGGPALAMAVGVLAFPFVYALSPASWSWTDGRYSYFLPPLLAIVVAVGATEAVRRVGLTRSAGSWLMAAVLVVSATVCVLGVRALVTFQRAAYTTTWGNPDDATLHAIRKMEAAGIRTAYANYWEAYKLDFLAKGHLVVTTAGYEDDRSAAIDATVDHSSRPAWLFVPPSEASIDATQFTAPSLTVAIDSVTQGEFERTLDRLGIPYRVHDFGILRAVVPDRTVTQSGAGMPGAATP